MLKKNYSLPNLASATDVHTSRADAGVRPTPVGHSSGSETANIDGDNRPPILRRSLDRLRTTLKSISALRARGGHNVARCVPFFLFIATLALSSAFDLRWLVIARGGIVALALLWFWPQYSELQHPSPTHFGYWLLAAFAGFAVFLAWIWLDRDWMMLGHAAGFDPRLQNGMAGWSHALARLAGLALVVPVMEELFWRSFLLRWLQHNQFLSVDPRQTHWTTSFATAMVFGLEHNQWLAGLLAGLVYNGLYTRSRDLRVPILAHAVTNGVLGLWILTTGSWQFW